MSWFGQSIVATIFLIPAFLAIGFFEKNYHVKPSVFLIWYVLGVGMASAFFGPAKATELFPSLRFTGAIVFIGLTAGGIANVLLYQAVAHAPNPGLPVVISNGGASMGVFLVAALLAYLLPTYFNPVKVDFQSFLGIVLTVMGISLIALRK